MDKESLQKLKMARAVMALTPYEVSKRSGYPLGNLGRVLKGEIFPSQKSFRAMANALNEHPDHSGIDPDALAIALLEKRLEKRLSDGSPPSP